MGDISLRGQGRAFLQRKRFAEGSGPEKIEIGEGKIGEPVVVTPEEMDKLLNPPEIKIPRIPSDKEIKDVTKSVEDFKKKEKQEPKLQFRCQGPNQEKKCGHRDEKKKGGSTTPVIPPALKKGMKKIGLKHGGKPGLWANINARKKAGTSRSKSESTISSKAYANMKAGFPKKKK